MAQGFAFTSFDGEDENGVRSEVHVQKGTGTIKAIQPHDNAKVANIQISTEGLRFPQKAWINVDTPQFKVVQEAFDEGKTIEYRIESQRKLKNDATKKEIPRDTPIAELRSSTEIARDNTKTLLVGVNGELTDEAVTHPAEDPNTSGRRPAADPAIAKAAATTSAAPAQNGNGNGNGFGGPAVEEPPFKEFNSDGTVNLGSYAVQAAVGAELFVRKLLAASDVDATQEDIIRYASISLAIADKIQAYVTKKPRANRMVTSHTRIRSLVYDVIENFLPIPLEQKGAGDAEWVSKVGKLTLDRFNASMAIAQQPFDLASLTSGAAPAQSQARVQAPVQEQPPADEYPQDVPEDTQVNVPADEKTVKSAQPKVAAASKNPLADAKPSLEMFPPVKAEPVTDDNKMSPETLETFKEFVTEAGADFSKLTKLLRYTFGDNITKASQVPEEQFEGFLDFYTGEGDEHFLAVLDRVDSMIQ